MNAPSLQIIFTDHGECDMTCSDVNGVGEARVGLAQRPADGYAKRTRGDYS